MHFIRSLLLDIVVLSSLQILPPIDYCYLANPFKLYLNFNFIFPHVEGFHFQHNIDL